MLPIFLLPWEACHSTATNLFDSVRIISVYQNTIKRKKIILPLATTCHFGTTVTVCCWCFWTIFSFLSLSDSLSVELSLSWFCRGGVDKWESLLLSLAVLLYLLLQVVLLLLLFSLARWNTFFLFLLAFCKNTFLTIKKGESTCGSDLSQIIKNKQACNKQTLKTRIHAKNSHAKTPDTR